MFEKELTIRKRSIGPKPRAKAYADFALEDTSNAPKSDF
jgi:hypothetical protein